MKPNTALRDQYKAGKLALIQHFAAQANPLRQVRLTLKAMAQHTDQLLKKIWLQADFPTQLALVAVGGYGRGELFPYSDVDILLLVPDGISPDQDPALKSKIEAFISSCWDCGLDLGSSVRNIAQCAQEAKQDITSQTCMLESRRICGSEAQFVRLTQALMSIMKPSAFFMAKSLEMHQRHHRQENTPYALEPNCKESPGGLRDLHIILWVAKAAGLGRSWSELGRKGLATAKEVRQLKANEAILSLIRIHLHATAQRGEDRLVFDLQNQVAQAMGIHPLVFATANADGSGVTALRDARRASELLMKRYYWAAKAVVQLNQILLLNIEEHLSQQNGLSTHVPRPINERFFEKAGMLEVASDDLYIRQPHAILETFLLYQTTVGIKGLSAKTLRALYNARHVMTSDFRQDPVNRQTFLRILQQPVGITHAMRLMNETSILGRYLWVFRHTVGQMQHDLFHVYTVDQHILMVLRNVRRFFMAEHSHEYPFCSQLAAGWDKPWILYLAALFHDIAKGRGGDHSDLGAHEVRLFAKQHHLAADDGAMVEFLVSEHLSMSRIAQKEDLSNPDVIAAFAKRVQNERRLTALYLLTVADIRGTSPKVWNAWKARLLEDLYKATLRVLGGAAPDPSALVESQKREALQLLALHTLPHNAHQTLWQTLDVGYFMRHDANEIAWHTRQISKHLVQTSPPQTLVRARLSPNAEGIQILVYTADQNDLFARICSYFDHAGLSILTAKIHTTRNHQALDTFLVTNNDLDSTYRELMAMAEVDLCRIIDTQAPLPAPSKGRTSRRVKHFPITPRVELRPDEKAQQWLLNISSSDRIGLLYQIAKILTHHHISVQLAKITTLGERVEDTFLISGAALQHNRTQIEIETELLKALND